MLNGGIEAHLFYRTGKLALRERVDAEMYCLAETQMANIGLCHAGIDLHLAQVIGDLEQCRGLEARSNGLPDVHVACDHHA